MKRLMKRQWGVVIDSRKGVIYLWDTETEEWKKGADSEENPNEYFACVKHVKEIRDNSEPFIKTLNENKE